MSIQKGLHLGDRVWVRVPTAPIERRLGTIKAVKGNRYSVEWDIDTREGLREYTGGEIVALRSGQGHQNGDNLH